MIGERLRVSRHKFSVALIFVRSLRLGLRLSSWSFSGLQSFVAVDARENKRQSGVYHFGVHGKQNHKAQFLICLVNAGR